MREGDVLTRRYRLVEQIASGGMSAIWRAFDQSLHRTVAIKVLDGSVGGDHGGRDLIRREARATARLIHPDAIEVYDYGETVTARGRLAAYVVMRLLDGRPLSERITEGPLPWREAAVIGARVALVLAAAHQRGIVHRDVTAENVLLTPEGAKLLDFGIAAFVGEQVDKRLADFGTPPYVAPERLTCASVHPAVDVYALGVLLFEMLTAAHPYPETTWEGLEAARRTGPPPAPSGVPGLPPEVAELCRSCLSQEPGDRPSAQHVAETLTASLSASVAAVRETAVWMRRARMASVAVAALATWTAALLWIQPDLPGPVAAAVSSRSTEAGPSGTPAPESSDRHSGALAEPISEGSGSEAPDRSPATAASQPEASSPPRSPGPSRSPRSPDPPAAEPERTAAPAGTRALPTLTQAVGRFDAALAAGETTGEIRADVALDLRQVVHNLLQSLGDPGEGLKGVRRKLDDRAREGGLTPGVHAELDRGLTLIGAALQKAA
ncbi:protein kinase domain-containing protein [Sphaerisporangium viridialbum]|uniref:serine/threonine-protein kinase n=1 Tax=Sphaerisporangium viridialbum TaxID=46189 RepID=UPI003C70BDFD